MADQNKPDSFPNHEDAEKIQRWLDGIHEGVIDCLEQGRPTKLAMGMEIEGVLKNVTVDIYATPKDQQQLQDFLARGALLAAKPEGQIC